MLNNRGQTTTAHHWGWMCVVLAIFFTCAWIYSANRPNSFAAGSTQNTETTNRYALAELVFSPFNWAGCQTIPKKTPPQTFKISPVDTTTKDKVAPVTSPTETTATALGPKEESGW